MKVILPLHLDGMQKLLFNHGSACLITLFCICLIFGVFYIYLDDGETQDTFLHGAVAFLAIFIGLFAFFMAFIGFNNAPDEIENTAYDADPSNTTQLYWDDTSNYIQHTPSYLRLSDDDNIKFAKMTYSHNAQTITPLNNSGKAWLIVAKAIEETPKPHTNVRIDAHLAYTKGSVDTENGTEKFICYANNKGLKQDSGYKVLKHAE